MKGLCKWCDTLTDDIVKVLTLGKLTWVGCIECYEKKKELEKQ